MAGRYGRKYTKNEDFDEGEVWGVMEESKEMFNPSPKLRKSMKDSSFFTTSSTSPRTFTAVNAPRMIPRSSEVSTDGSKQSSAPLDIPDWSKIYGKNNNSKKKKNVTTTTTSSSSSWVNYNNNNNNNNGHDDSNGYYYNSNGMGVDQQHQYGNGGHNGGDDGDDDGDDDDIDGVVPPHEYLARKLARNQISSFSVYEGIGRTLKGRDLSKVRNTILSKTGFLE